MSKPLTGAAYITVHELSVKQIVSTLLHHDLLGYFLKILFAAASISKSDNVDLFKDWNEIKLPFTSSCLSTNDYK